MLHDIQYLHSTVLCNLAAMLALCELGTQRQMFLNCIILVFHVGIQLYNVFLEKDDETSYLKTEMEKGKMVFLITGP